jgi:hypothetical protein
VTKITISHTSAGDTSVRSFASVLTYPPHVRFEVSDMVCITSGTAPVRVAASLLWHGIDGSSTQSWCRIGNAGDAPRRRRIHHRTRRRMAGRDAGAVARRRTGRACDVRPHRCHESLEPSRRAGVQSVAERQALGTAERALDASLHKVRSYRPSSGERRRNAS